MRRVGGVFQRFQLRASEGLAHGPQAGFCWQAAYVRNEGFRTPDFSLPFKFLGNFEGQDFRMARPARIEPATPAFVASDHDSCCGRAPTTRGANAGGLKCGGAVGTSAMRDDLHHMASSAVLESRGGMPLSWHDRRNAASERVAFLRSMPSWRA